MARYRYLSLTSAGTQRRGHIEAGSREDALRLLAARGETATSLSPMRSGAPGISLARSELAVFLADLAALHEAGVPLRKALDVLSSGAATNRAAEFARMLSERLDAGADLGRATSAGATGDLALAAELVRAGEASGRLTETLRFAAELLRRQSEFAKRIGNALAYPAFLLVLSVGALIALAAFAGPAIAPLLQDAPGDASGLKAVLGVGEVLRTQGLTILVCLAGFVLAVTFAASRPPLRAILATFRARMPIVGPIVRDVNCGAFARTLGALLSGGAPATSSIDLAAAAVPNEYWRARFLAAGERLREGSSIASALLSVPGTAPELSRLARVGEASGALGEMLSRAGYITIDRALRRLDQVSSVAGPLLIVIMGGFTGWLMSAFLSGLSQLGEGAP